MDEVICLERLRVEEGGAEKASRDSASFRPPRWRWDTLSSLCSLLLSQSFQRSVARGSHLERGDVILSSEGLTARGPVRTEMFGGGGG